MEHQKILNLLNESSNSKFVTRDWNIISGQSSANYSAENKIIYKADVLKSNLCDYNYAYILVTGDITIIGCKNPTEVVFKNYAPFIKCITKIYRVTIDGAIDIDLVMPMYKLLEYSSNYSDTIGSLWFHFKNEATNLNADIEDTNDFKSFKWKT